MKLSIITVNLNNRDGLQKTIDSVICQTFKDFEWIIIDGGSTDGSKELIEQYSKHFSYWVSEPDKGIYNAMNKGILKARGEYCFFLNSGDYLIDNSKLQSALGIQFDEDVVYGDILFDRDGQIETIRTSKEITLRTIIEGFAPHSGCAFIKKEAFDKWGLYDENLKIVSDWKWYLQFVGLGPASTRHLDIVLSIFPLNGTSSSNSTWIERETVLQQIVPQRILIDYMQFHGLENKLYEQQLEIRSSYPYRIGAIILAPVKWIMNIINKNNA